MSNSKKRLEWAQYALKLAQVAAERSEDPYRQVGACILRHDKSVASLGYNGAPPNVEIDWSDREKRRKFCVHAECNALRYCKPHEGYIIACTCLPCPSCMTQIAAYGINIVYYDEDYTTSDESLEIAQKFGINLWKLNRETLQFQYVNLQE